MTNDDFKQVLAVLAKREAREKLLEAAIIDAIRVLEETKQSFKSRKLGELRERLMAALSERN
jgi:hypothetical protein